MLRIFFFLHNYSADTRHMWHTYSARQSYPCSKHNGVIHEFRDTVSPHSSFRVIYTQSSIHFHLSVMSNFRHRGVLFSQTLPPHFHMFLMWHALSEQ